VVGTLDNQPTTRICSKVNAWLTCVLKDWLPMIETEKQLEIARPSLLDLTPRNRLLNLRPTKARAIDVIMPAEDLVESEKGLT